MDNSFINLKTYFSKDNIEINQKKFCYTNNLLQKHYEVIDLIQEGFELWNNNKIFKITNQTFNNIEKDIISWTMIGLTDDVNYLETYWESKFYSIACYDYLDEEFFNDIFNTFKDLYNDFDSETHLIDCKLKTELNDLKMYHNYLKFRTDVLEYHANKYQIMDNIVNNWDEDIYLSKIALEEYEDNLYYNIVNEDKLHKAIFSIHEYIQENLLIQKTLKKHKKKQKKDIIELLGSVDSINQLKYDRIYKHSKPKKTNVSKEQIKKCYIIKDKMTGYYKIGNSKTPLEREKTLQSEKPTLESIKIFQNNHEKTLHYNYKKQRVRGEWFDLTKTQVKYICTHFK
tara:strand:+ start:43 stop:1068 length:1026 start_codon:yes stop_codon:yes gene_type:complete